MKLYAPGYYSKFKCIADKCKSSCCIGWEIDIDRETLEKYRNIPSIYKTIDASDVPYFRLSEDGRCPHLDECGLCNIINHYGEDYLAEICREHPRYYNITSRGREVGLGLVCEEASRIVLSSDEYFPDSYISSDDEASFDDCPDNYSLIQEIYGILSDRKIKYKDRLIGIYEKTGVSPGIYSDEYCKEVFSSCELLDESHGDLFSLYTSSINERNTYEKELERFLAYLIYRHVSGAENETDIRSSLGFAFLLERLFASILNSAFCHSYDDVLNIASIISLELEYSEDNKDNIKLEFVI